MTSKHDNDALTELAQEVLDLISDRMQKEGLIEMGPLLNMLAGIAAHFLAGIEDVEIQATAFQGFGKMVSDHIVAVRDTENHAHVTVASTSETRQ